MASKLRKSKHLSASKMKASLKKLEKEDPELVKFMKAEDSSIFDFNESSTSEEEDEGETHSDKGSENDDDDDDDDDMEEDDNSDDEVHQVPKKLKTASDSDSEVEAESSSKSGKKKRLVTVQMIRHWAKLMQERNSIPALQDLMSAFKSAVQQARDDGEEEIQTKFKVEGTAVFNAVVSTSVIEIPAFLKRFLDVKESKDGSIVLPSTSNKWKRVKVDVRSYATDLLQLLGQMASADVISVLLKHVHQMVAYIACFPKLPKLLLKRLIQLWSTGEETSRLLAFMSIMRLVLLLPDALLEFSLKHMYRTYVSNCKFTSVNTLHLINFMQRCLVEIFGVRLDLTYHFAFIYIRQLAIHLRNAITLQKKDCIQTVYNWQYIHSLFLWTRLMSAHHTEESIHSLIHPLTQIIIGTIKLVPSAQYYPLRFHCVRALNMLSESTGVYIPVLPFLTQVLDAPEMRRKPKAAGAKAFVFPCILKLTKPQIQDKAFQDGVLEQLYELFLLHMNIHSHTLGFPELILPTQIQIKKFIKTCKIPAHVKKLKQLIDKAEEASKVTVQRRKKTTINLRDSAAVAAWEVKNKEQGNPLSTFVTNWKKLRERQLQQVNHDQMLGSDLPKIERPKGPKVASVEERTEFKDLFKSDEESESEDESRFMLKEERTAKEKDPKPKTSVKGKELPKKRKRDESESESDYSDFDDEDLEALNRSGSDDNDDNVNDDDEDSEESSNDEENADDVDDIDEDTGDVVKDFDFSDF